MNFRKLAKCKGFLIYIGLYKLSKTNFLLINVYQYKLNLTVRSLKPCPHCHRKVRLSQKTARQRRQSHFSATV